MEPFTVVLGVGMLCAAYAIGKLLDAAKFAAAAKMAEDARELERMRRDEHLQG